MKGRIVKQYSRSLIFAALVILGLGSNARPAPALKSGDTFKDCTECPEMVVVPAGSFTIGSPEDEKGRDNNEGPQHRVSIAQPFAVGKFEVMFEEWEACVADGGCNGYRPEGQGWGRGNRPVIIASWSGTRVYVAWLKQKTGKPYRLLSEAEWEYAARRITDGKAGPPYWWREDADKACGYANGPDLTAKEPGSTVVSCHDGFVETAPVGSFAPNRFGLHDMAGNVWEWVEDCYQDSYQGAPSDGSVWTTDDCKGRILRGGSWSFFPGDLRAAFRYKVSREVEAFLGRNDSGFRVARVLTPKEIVFEKQPESKESPKKTEETKPLKPLSTENKTAKPTDRSALCFSLYSLIQGCHQEGQRGQLSSNNCLEFSKAVVMAVPDEKRLGRIAFGLGVMCLEACNSGSRGDRLSTYQEFQNICNRSHQPTASVDIPNIKTGDTYIIESLNLDNSALSNTTERKVVFVGEGKITVASKNIKSKTGSTRTIQFTPEWNLITQSLQVDNF